MTTRATSWSGSETQRREQGGCTPAPKTDFGTIYRIPSGTSVAYKMGGDDDWAPHITRIPLEFNEREDADSVYFYFRHCGYRIRVPQVSVTIGGAQRRRR